MSFTDELMAVHDGSTTWRDRLSPTIELTAPDGTLFSAKWRGDPRSGEKRLGIFSGPGWPGNIIQDLGVESDRYTFTIYFEGKDHDVYAAAFHETCKQSGAWIVNHPVHGVVELYLVRWTETDDPTESGNVTEFSTEWVEPIDETTLQTARQMAGIVDDTVMEYAAISGGWYEDTVYADTYGEQATCGQTAERLASAADTQLGDLARGNADVRSSYNSSQEGLADAVASPTFDPGSIAGNLRGIIQTPALGSTNVADRLSAYSDYIDDAIAMLPTGTSRKCANKIATVEASLDAALGAVCRVVTTGSLPTRSAAISAAQSIVEMLSRVTNALDDSAAQFNDLRIDRQYFSQSQTYQAAVAAISSAVNYLMIAAFDLAIEKRFKLPKPKTPLQIVIEEYGDDTRLDEFIEANGLRSYDVIWLDAGREVVVYV